MFSPRLFGLAEEAPDPSEVRRVDRCSDAKAPDIMQFTRLWMTTTLSIPNDFNEVVGARGDSMALKRRMAAPVTARRRRGCDKLQAREPAAVAWAQAKAVSALYVAAVARQFKPRKGVKNLLPVCTTSATMEFDPLRVALFMEFLADTALHTKGNASQEPGKHDLSITQHLPGISNQMRSRSECVAERADL